jgi:carbonic anhydrase/acetyltransferase-like protein (isoleucine patch superfamily)
MEIPDYSLVLGTPAKVVKTLNEDQINRLKFGPPHYVKMGAEHKSGKFPLLTAVDFE